MNDLYLENPYIYRYPEVTYDEYYGGEDDPEEPYAVYDPD